MVKLYIDTMGSWGEGGELYSVYGIGSSFWPRAGCSWIWRKKNQIITKGLKIRWIKLKPPPIEPQKKLKIIKTETKGSHKFFKITKYRQVNSNELVGR